MEEKDLEKLVLQGLEYEAIEKAKAAERKALTRKNGLKPEDAKYSQDKSGQTRDIVAEKLGISGRQWERMRFIYQHRDCFLDEEYENWRIGKISTSKLYNELSQDIRYNETLDNMMKILKEMKMVILGYEQSHIIADIKRDMSSAVFNCQEKVKEEVFSNFDKLIQYNQKVLTKHYNEISMMQSNIMELKSKLKCKTHSYI